MKIEIKIDNQKLLFSDFQLRMLDKYKQLMDFPIVEIFSYGGQLNETKTNRIVRRFIKSNFFKNCEYQSCHGDSYEKETIEILTKQLRNGQIDITECIAEIRNTGNANMLVMQLAKRLKNENKH